MNKLDLVYMIGFLLVYVFVILKNCSLKLREEKFFDQNDTIMLRGIFCIIVVMVHIPNRFQNPIQDLIGSFAYIGVTFFFMSSSYGIKYGILNKANYMHDFWPKRLVNLLIPMLFYNMINLFLSYCYSREINFLSLFYIANWVKVLLLDYFIFWFVYKIFRKLGKKDKYYADLTICICISMTSLITEFTAYKLAILWPIETIGFIYGILLSKYYEKIENIIEKKWNLKFVFIFCLSFLLGVLYIKFKKVDIWGNYFLKIILGFVIIVLILMFLKRIRLNNSILAFLGKISYEVYLLHGVVFYFWIKMDVIKHSGIFVVTAIISTLILAYAVHFLSEILIKFVRSI